MMDREHSCCFTGHRPQKLPWGFDESDARCDELKHKLKITVADAITNDKTMFITGMAMGTDIWCAEAVLEMKKTNPQVRLVAAVPYAGQDRKYPEPWKSRYQRIIEAADEVITLRPHYTSGCLHQRNRFMVDNSSMLIAVFTGEPGGTKDTIEYARNKGLEITIITP